MLPLLLLFRNILSLSLLYVQDESMVHLPVYENLVQFTHVPWITNILSLCRVIKRCAETVSNLPNIMYRVFNIVAFTKIVYIEISLECFWYILSYSSKYIVHILKNLFIEYFYFLKMY